MLGVVPRAVPLTESATWWPSTAFQTTTLELRRSSERLLVDPGVSPWEIEEVVEASSDPVTQVLVTHADWDHVMALGMLPAARVTASTGAGERIRSGQAKASIEKEAVEAYVPYRELDHLHCEHDVDPPADVQLGPWSGTCRAGRGHTDDGLITWLPDERVLVVGDYLSELEIPFAYSSVADYRATLHTLIGVIERERPAFVVVGHGHPHTAERALEIADEDLDYIDGILAFAEAGCPPDQASRIAVPFRGGGPYDRQAHTANVKLACEAAGAPVPA
jgi:glyoxylase-like metal-dependent hydrolase (beta-lactamase superfamily II)